MGKKEDKEAELVFDLIENTKNENIIIAFHFIMEFQDNFEVIDEGILKKKIDLPTLWVNHLYFYAVDFYDAMAKLVPRWN